MYAYIKGELVQVADEHLVLETSGGVAYEINIGVNMASKLQAARADTSAQVTAVAKLDMDNSAATTNTDAQEQLKIYTSLIVREDAHLLYGFLEQKQKKLFDLLLSIPRIGAKLAMAITDNITAEDLALAVMQDNVKQLTQIKGLGQKVAQRLLMDLKDKLQKLNLVIGAAVSEAELLQAVNENTSLNSLKMEDEQESKSHKYQDLLSALLVLGFTVNESKRMLKQTFDATLTLEANLKLALQVK